jgi:FkbM family methyltransferase
MTRADLVHLAKRTLHRMGWSVERATSGGWQPNRTYWNAEYMRRWAVRPRTVIDVGVGNGTPNLYEAFPDARLVLVEPLAEFAAPIAATLARRPGVHFPVAVGAAAAERDVRVEPRFAERSSFYARHELAVTGDPTTVRRVTVTTLDALLAAHRFEGPFVLKIDAEGAELEVVRGATEVLRHTELVIAEVSVLDRFAGGYTFAEFVAAMDDAGFAARDVLGIGRADSSDVTFVDLAFKRRAPVR